MSDPEKSGAPLPASADSPAASALPAAEGTASHAVPLAVSTPGAFGAFAGNRGSGLARGKRPSAPAATPPGASPAPASGYKPSTIQVMKPQSEYRNPFTGETSVASPEPVVPAAVAPVAPAPDAPTPVARAAQPEPRLPVPLPSPAAHQEARATAPVGSPIPDSSASLDAAARSEPATPSGQTAQSNNTPAGGNASKQGLNILPPAPANRDSVRWDSTPAGAGETPAPTEGRREDRGTFQPREKRNRPGEAREGQDPRAGEGREGGEGRSSENRGGEGRSFENRGGGGRRERRDFQHRDPRDAPEPRGGGNLEPRESRDRRPEPRAQPYQERSPRSEYVQPAPAPNKKPGGFLGWLKGLFGGSSPDTPATDVSPSPRREGDDRGYRGERGGDRGGRGRGGHPGGGGGGGNFQGGGGDMGGDGRRRRRRGGRGRNRGPGGGDDGGPRPEGQQGGGAI